EEEEIEKDEDQGLIPTDVEANPLSTTVGQCTIPSKPASALVSMMPPLTSLRIAHSSHATKLPSPSHSTHTQTRRVASPTYSNSNSVSQAFFPTSEVHASVGEEQVAP
ncbi:hypothetical protein NDU88_002866, partial [Pleurodeles waltl]